METGLVAAVGHTADLAPNEAGIESHADIVSSKFTDMMSDLGVKPEDVYLVLVKYPLLASAKLATIRTGGRQLMT